MISAELQKTFSLLIPVKYTYAKDEEYDYLNEPRPCHNLVFMLDGEGVIQTKGETFVLKKGDILLVPKDTVYSSKWIAKPKVVFHSLHFFLPFLQLYYRLIFLRTFAKFSIYRFIWFVISS